MKDIQTSSQLQFSNFDTHIEKKGTCSTFAVVLLYFPEWKKKHLSHYPFLIPLGRNYHVGNLNTNHPDVLIQQAECWTPIYMNQMFGKGAPKFAFLSGITNYSNVQFIWDSLFCLKHLLDSFFSSSKLLNGCPHTFVLLSGTLRD